MLSQLLYRLVNITRVDVVYENRSGVLTAFFDAVEDSPLMTFPALRQILKTGAADGPFLYRDDYNAFFGAIAHEGGFLYLGPMCNSRLDPLRRGQFYRSYQIESQDVRSLKYFSYQQIRDILLLTVSLVTGEECPEETVVLSNPVKVSSEEELRREKQASIRSEEYARDEESYRHTYHEEQKLLLAVQEGERTGRPPSLRCAGQRDRLLLQSGPDPLAHPCHRGNHPDQQSGHRCRDAAHRRL